MFCIRAIIACHRKSVVPMSKRSLFETGHHSPENETPEATCLVSKLVSKSKYHILAMLLSFDTKTAQFTSQACTGPWSRNSNDNLFISRGCGDL
jgi:hypothetical protein